MCGIIDFQRIHSFLARAQALLSILRESFDYSVRQIKSAALLPGINYCGSKKEIELVAVTFHGILR